MGKFGGFNVSGFVSKASSVASNALSKVESIPESKLTSIMEKATVGNAVSFVGGKIGLNLDAGKIDNVVSVYQNMKSNIGGMIMDTVLKAAETAGYKVSLPDGDKIANYIMNNKVIMGKIENLGDNISEGDIKNIVNNIDIPKMATDLGLGISKVPMPESKEAANSAVSSTTSNAINIAGSMGKVIGEGVGNIGTEVNKSIQDVSNIVKETTTND